MLQQEIKFTCDGLTLIDLEHIPSPSSAEDFGKWLIDQIWANPGTGIIAGMPKTGKTWLALQIAVAVSSGLPLFGRFPTHKGTVLIYSPEGSPVEVRDRFMQVLKHSGDHIGRAPVYFMRKQGLCLANKKDQEAVELAVMEVKPKLLIFDPLAESFSKDENSAAEVKGMTTFVNHLAREYSCSVLLTHHISKNAGGNNLGSSMRGSSALFAFGDSYLFLDRNKANDVVLSSLQRHGKPLSPMILKLSESGNGTGYEINGAVEEKPKEDLGDRILALLREMNKPMSLRGLRKELGGKTAHFTPMLKELKDAGEIEQTKDGWVIKQVK